MEVNEYRWRVGFQVLTKCEKTDCDICRKGDPDHQGFTKGALQEYGLSGCDALIVLTSMKKKDKNLNIVNVPTSFNSRLYGIGEAKNRGNYMFAALMYIAKQLPTYPEEEVTPWQKAIAEGVNAMVEKYTPEEHKIKQAKIESYSLSDREKL